MNTVFKNIPDVQGLAQAIVDTVRDPLLVLDRNLCVITANRSFHDKFGVNRAETEGKAIYSLGSGEWNIPALRTLLEKILPEHAVMDGFEVDSEFPGIGRRIMLLNSRKVFYEGQSNTTLLIAFEDITDRRAIEREKS